MEIMNTEAKPSETPVPVPDTDVEPVSTDIEMGIFKGGIVWHILTQKKQVKKQRFAAGLCGTIGIVTHPAKIKSIEIGTFIHFCIDCQYMFNSKLRAPDIQFNGPAIKSLDDRKI